MSLAIFMHLVRSSTMLMGSGSLSGREQRELDACSSMSRLFERSILSMGRKRSGLRIPFQLQLSHSQYAQAPSRTRVTYIPTRTVSRPDLSPVSHLVGDGATVPMGPGRRRGSPENRHSGRITTISPCHDTSICIQTDILRLCMFLTRCKPSRLCQSANGCASTGRRPLSIREQIYTHSPNYSGIFQYTGR